MNIQETLTQRIKEQFVNLLTDEELEILVKKEIDSFFDDKTKVYFSIKRESNYYNSSSTKIEVNGEMSPIRQMVYQIIVEMTADKIKSENIKNYFNELIEKEDGTVDTKIGKHIQEAIPLAINTYFENIARNMVSQLQYSLMNNNQNY